jgi:D-beta-D-heptose 7-phosphate kinase/D-beta-D-heptose 1-phosphate adenosyltransferase
MKHATAEISAAETRELLHSMTGRRVAVIGDVMLDSYLHGPLERISPEAPVPVFEVTREEYKLGGAANVAASLAALGATVRLCGTVGSDDHGARLLNEAHQLGIDTTAILAESHRPTTCKTRVVARNQQVLRLDRETRVPIAGQLESHLAETAQSVAEWAEAVVLSDYAKGVLTPEICSQVIRASGRKPVIVDPKKQPWDRYRGATIIKPNRVESELFTQTNLDSDATAAQAAELIAKTLETAHVLITRGSAGMTLATCSNRNRAFAVHHFAANPRELVDVTGAGDVVAATLAIVLAAGADVLAATWLANVAAGIKVGKFGAASVTPAEILTAIGSGTPSFAQKVLPREHARTLVQAAQHRGRKVVFTNGCFDLLHLGHVTYLEQSKQLGDFLVVGVNSDASVRRLKGSQRPLQKESDRAQIIASQASVDAVVVFDEDTPLELIRTLRPDIITKGADYTKKEAVVGWQLVESWGGRVALIELIEGRSTTRLVTHAA